LYNYRDKNIDKVQYININDFIIDQNQNLFNKNKYNGHINKLFNEKIINEIITPQIKEILLNNKQIKNTQVIYVNNLIKINPSI
jgi:hypothetical protein